MLSYFSWRPIREWNEDGLLVTTGYEWTDRNKGVYEIFGSGAALLFWYACLGAASKFPRDNDVSLIFVASFACFVICCFYGRTYLRLTFESDGRVVFTNPDRLFGSEMVFHMDDIASIELTKFEQQSGIVLLTRDGDTIVLSRCLHEFAARKAAVQATKALREMRESRASLASFAASAWCSDPMLVIS
jgi:hypothetical protein